ncbi:MAG: Crp/Fnr family transcriptional regulator [Puia sp.]|nr:Crp/Fnr family transcriptional regulator [Puia sp.]
MEDTTQDILRAHIEEIVSLTDDEFERAFSAFTLRRLKKHQFVVQSGGLVDSEFFVVKGLLKASFTNEQGRTHILQFAMENWWVSDYLALNRHTYAALDIDCLEESVVLCLSRDTKANVCAASHKMEHFFRIKTGAGYVSLQQRILSLMNDDAQSRYAQLLKQYPSLFQRVPKALIAAYLGVSRETLSRLSR